MGVSICPCAVLILPARAFVPEQLDTSSNNILVFKNGIKDNYSEEIERSYLFTVPVWGNPWAGAWMADDRMYGEFTDIQAIYCSYQF